MVIFYLLAAYHNKENPLSWIPIDIISIIFEIGLQFKESVLMEEISTFNNRKAQNLTRNLHFKTVENFLEHYNNSWKIGFTQSEQTKQLITCLNECINKKSQRSYSESKNLLLEYSKTKNAFDNNRATRLLKDYGLFNSGMPNQKSSIAELNSNSSQIGKYL